MENGKWNEPMLHFHSPSFVGHERIRVIRRRAECLLDRARADPAYEVEFRTGLVVRAARARATERLLSDYGTGRLVVDVEVSRGVAQRERRFANGASIVREHGARERVG